MLKDAHDLGLIVASRIPLIRLESFEEQRALQLLTRVGISQSLPLSCWSITDGLQRLGFGQDVANAASQDPEAVLEYIKSAKDAALFTLCDFHPYFHNNPKIVRLLKDIALQQNHTVVLLSHAIEVPGELGRYTAYFKLSLPDDAQIMKLVRDEAKNWAELNAGIKVKSDNATIRKLVGNLRGMTFDDTRRLIRGVIFDDGAITENDIPELNKAKFELMDMDGVLSFEYDTEQFSDVGGLDNLKAWLTQRHGAFLSDEEHVPVGIDRPKGILLLGIQGGGKSLAAKAVAGLWGLPLLRLDFGALYNKFIGETEKNLREALQQAELMSPCVLWLDELEKGLGSSDNDDGVSRRVLGTLLTWMSERPSSVFMVATSNDIRALPAELVRKGRFDEIFFVDLPDDQVRQDIFAIHLARREQSRARFDLPLLASLSEGFTGAEIEQVVVSGLYTAAAQEQVLDSDILIQEIMRTNPLSVTMAEAVAQLRQWALERTVPA
jgi:SpoVK/Ycf46/Vps4 family AAA+-type ATPase